MGPESSLEDAPHCLEEARPGDWESQITRALSLGRSAGTGGQTCTERSSVPVNLTPTPAL